MVRAVTGARRRLAGKVAYLAGATSGIGKATAEVFAAEGARVVVTGRRETEGEGVAAAIRADRRRGHLPAGGRH